jgi:hypothetical protein
MQPGMFGAFFQGSGTPLSVGHISRDPGSSGELLDAVCLMLDRRGEQILLPEDDIKLRPGDQLLFVGGEDALARQQRYLLEPGTVEYVRTGQEPARGWLFRNVENWWRHRRAHRVT